MIICWILKFYKSSNNSHISGYFWAIASSSIKEASLLILNSGVVFFKYLKQAVALADHKLILGFLETSSLISCILSSLKEKLFVIGVLFLTDFLDFDLVLTFDLDFGLDLAFLFDTNPFLLNINYKEIDATIKKKTKMGCSNEEIRDYFYYESCKMI